MSRLYLACYFCTRRQADGLLSRNYWGHLELEGGSALRACPTCKEAYPDWEQRLRATVQAPRPGDGGGFEPRSVSA